MKLFLFVLLGLCAFASASNIFDDIPDVDFLTYEPMIMPRSGDIAGPALVNGYMEKTTNEFNGLVQKFKDISGTYRKQVENFNEVEQSLVENKFTGLMQDIQNLVRKGAKYATCSSKHQNEVMEVANHATDSIKNCAVEIADALKIMAKEISATALVLAGDFMRLKEIVMDCYNRSKLSGAKCVYDNFSEMKTLIGKLINGTKATIEAFKVHGKVLIDSVKQCNTEHIQSSLIKFDEFKVILADCANS